MCLGKRRIKTDKSTMRTSRNKETDIRWKEEYDRAIDNYDINKAQSLKDDALKKLGYSLFRDRKFDVNNLEAVVNKQMWMALPNTFNDPLEFSFTIKDNNDEQAKALLSDIKKLIPEVAEIEEQHFKDLEQKRKETLEEFSVCCFMEDNTSQLMWSHYGDSHEGFCIEYDFSEKRFNDFLYPVCYRKEVFELDLSHKNVDYLPVQISKSDDWSYENEWRIIFPEKDKGLHESPSIKAIYLGLKVKDENKESMINICRENRIPIYQMEVIRGTYSLKAKKLMD